MLQLLINPPVAAATPAPAKRNSAKPKKEPKKPMTDIQPTQLPLVAENREGGLPPYAVESSLSDPPSSAAISYPKPGVPDAPDSVDPVLVKILSWKRGHDSPGEIAFMSWLHSEIKARGGKPEVMAAGCVAVTVPRSDNKSVTTLFSCHTDTVDWKSGADTGPQKVVYDPAFGHIFLDKNDPGAGSCLGADDGAGVWLMLEMIREEVPGTYLFHRGEERGGIGSNAMLAKHRSTLEAFEAAVAFDRADDFEVIITQGGQKCASEKFGTALALELNKQDRAFNYKTSHGGTFTDTKVYRGVIAECVNVGVGYHAQHGQQETLDYGHLVRLRDACVGMNWNSLPIDRDPKAYEAPPYNGYKSPYDLYRDTWGYDDKKKSKKSSAKKDEPLLTSEQELEGLSFTEVMGFVEESPDMAAALLVDLASEVAALRTKVEYLKGALK